MQAAIKFYLDLTAFERERELYTESQLKEMMPATLAIEDNVSGGVATAYGYVFPPFVIIECGQSLDECQWTTQTKTSLPSSRCVTAGERFSCMQLPELKV